MANFAPTEIQQVTDFTPRSGDALLNIMSRESNPYNNIMDLVNRTIGAYTKAQESERMADAITKVRLAMENGKSIPEAYAGIDSRLLGTKALQDRTDAIRDSLLRADKNKLAWETERRQAAAQAIQNRLNNIQIQNEMDKRRSDALLADLMEHRNKFSSAGDSLWYNKHLNQIKASPLVYKQIMAEMSNAGSSVLPPAPINLADHKDYTVLNFDQDRRKLQKIENDLAQIGITDTNLDFASKVKSADDYTKRRNEVMKYEGDDLRDYNNNTNKAYNIAASYASTKGYSPEIIPLALQLAERSSWWGANDFNYNTIQKTMDKLDAKFSRNVGNFRYLQNAFKLFKDPEVQKNLEKELINRQIYLDRVARAGLSKEDKDYLTNSIYSRYDASTAPYRAEASKLPNIK